LLLCADGCAAYVKAARAVFREPLRFGQKGRPNLRPWDNLNVAQVVKQYVRKRVVGVERRLVQGSMSQVQTLVAETQGAGTINTSYIERLNATFRARLAALVRRGRALARQTTTLHQAMYLVGTVYNFCTYHHSLRVAIHLPVNRRRWVSRTPAIAAGITDHLWTVEELLSFQVPLPRWTPPKRRGRPSKATKALIAQWCSRPRLNVEIPIGLTTGGVASLDPDLTQSKPDKLCASMEQQLSPPLDGRPRLYGDLHVQGSPSIAYRSECGEGSVAPPADGGATMRF
jgi:hypothetical protein